MDTKKNLIKQFVKRTGAKFIVFIIAMTLVSACLTAMAPLISNDIAIGQMENDDTLYVMMEMYNNVQPIVSLIYIVIIVWFGIGIGRDIVDFVNKYKIINTNDG